MKSLTHRSLLANSQSCYLMCFENRLNWRQPVKSLSLMHNLLLSLEEKKLFLYTCQVIFSKRHLILTGRQDEREGEVFQCTELHLSQITSMNQKFRKYLSRFLHNLNKCKIDLSRSILFHVYGDIFLLCLFVCLFVYLLGSPLATA